MKRGQVTYFIIASIIILIAIVMILFARSEFSKNLYEEQRIKLVGVPADIKPVEEYVQNCLDEIEDDAITLVMLQGGYLYPNLDPGKYKEYTSIDIAHWYYGEEDLSPDINDIENNLAYYADEILPTCIDSISENYEFNEYNLSYNQIETNVNIKGDNFIFNSDINLNIEYKGKNYKIDKLTSSVKKDSIDVFNSAKLIFEDIKLSRNKLNLNKDYKYDLNLFYSDEDVIYSVYSNNTMVNFAVKFPEDKSIEEI